MPSLLPTFWKSPSPTPAEGSLCTSLHSLPWVPASSVCTPQACTEEKRSRQYTHTHTHMCTRTRTHAHTPTSSLCRSPGPRPPDCDSDVIGPPFLQLMSDVNPACSQTFPSTEPPISTCPIP
uniref:Uncharacterized protein n=1 Tax=Pipistrellus kuhlii TaxID=59472 RepID=A0A7J7VV46_PIPKU|nr:hypothetical protein mPipKuh1_008296 [Pipistrellus kuhlii]